MRARFEASRAALALALFAASCARESQPPNVLLIVVDTLRADRVGALGAARPLTPNIDALAAEGVLFTRAQSPRAKTTPAVASILTGLYPHQHGVRDLATPLDPSVPVLAEALRAGGWSTGAIVGNYVLRDELSGLRRGFESWVEDLPESAGVPPDDVPQRTARSMTDGALCALGLGAPSADGAGPARSFVRAGSPWFLYLHYMDPHGVYDPPAEHLVFHSEAPEPIPDHPPRPAGSIHRRWIAEYNVLPDERLSDGRIDAGLVRDRYDGEVHYVDAEIGRLIEALRASGALANTLVVLAADHGESLGEHDYWFEHGRYAYQATCHVPLALRFPDAMRDRPRNGARGGDVSLADVAPTLCELLRLPPLPPPPGYEPGQPIGRSFVDLLGDRTDAERAVFSEKVERTESSGTVQARAVRLGDWKLVQRFAELPDPTRSGELRPVLLSEELFDLRDDPQEARNLADEPPDGAPLERLRAELVRYVGADRDFRGLAQELQRRREELGRDDPETLRVLESLGY